MKLYEMSSYLKQRTGVRTKA